MAWAPWSIMRNKMIFGDDADLFRPERWLEVPPEKWRVMEQTVMMEFASGSRWECLGKVRERETPPSLRVVVTGKGQGFGQGELTIVEEYRHD